GDRRLRRLAGAELDEGPLVGEPLEVLHRPLRHVLAQELRVHPVDADHGEAQAGRREAAVARARGDGGRDERERRDRPASERDRERERLTRFHGPHASALSARPAPARAPAASERAWSSPSERSTPALPTGPADGAARRKAVRPA